MAEPCEIDSECRIDAMMNDIVNHTRDRGTRGQFILILAVALARRLSQKVAKRNRLNGFPFMAAH